MQHEIKSHLHLRVCAAELPFHFYRSYRSGVMSESSVRPAQVLMRLDEAVESESGGELVWVGQLLKPAGFERFITELTIQR